MEKITEFLSLELKTLDKIEALKAFANGAELSLFIKHESGKVSDSSYKNGAGFYVSA